MNRWENNIKRDLKEILCEDVDWVYAAQDREKVAEYFEERQ
jgi:hypothetical protein